MLKFEASGVSAQLYYERNWPAFDSSVSLLSPALRLMDRPKFTDGDQGALPTQAKVRLEWATLQD
jgi:hypothetical protein